MHPGEMRKFRDRSLIQSVHEAETALPSLHEKGKCPAERVSGPGPLVPKLSD